MRKQGRLAATIELDIPFHDADLMAVVWHGHYLKYLENARWALMERLDYGFDAMVASGFLWPMIDVHVRYIRPARFRERLRIIASLAEWESRLAIHYVVTQVATRERVARARTVQVAVDRASQTLLFASPPDFVQRVEAAMRAA